MSLPVIIPVKPFHLAKRRLRDVLAPAERATLARALFTDVLNVVLSAVAPLRIIVVTSDAEAASMAMSAGAQVRHEDPAAGLNPAIEAALTHRAVQRAGGFVMVPADVPEITAAALRKSLAALDREGSLVLVPANADGGTNLFGCRPPDALRPAFGPDSFARHLAAGERAGLACRVMDDAALGRDIDRPEDLPRFLAKRTSTSSDRLLRELGIAARCAALGIPPAAAADFAAGEEFHEDRHEHSR
jgi:2-phospho-L-lactate guanylyltransferase